MPKFIVSLCLITSSPAFACIASENFDIYFLPNSSHISNAEVARIAKWTADQKLNYANPLTKKTTLISGHAEKSEPGALALAQSRLQAAYALLEQLGFLRGTIKKSARVYSHGATWTMGGVWKFPSCPIALTSAATASNATPPPIMAMRSRCTRAAPLPARSLCPSAVSHQGKSHRTRWLFRMKRGTTRCNAAHTSHHIKLLTSRRCSSAASSRPSRPCTS